MEFRGRSSWRGEGRKDDREDVGDEYRSGGCVYCRGAFEFGHDAGEWSTEGTSFETECGV